MTNYHVSVQWWVLKLFPQNKPAFSGHVPVLLTTKAPPSPPLPSPSLSACLHINYCDMQVAKGHEWARNMHDLGLSEFLEVILVGYNWRAKGAVLINTFFCIIYRYFRLSMLVPSFFYVLLYPCPSVVYSAAAASKPYAPVAAHKESSVR